MTVAYIVASLLNCFSFACLATFNRPTGPSARIMVLAQAES